MRTRSALAAIVAALFAMTMLAAPAMATGDYGYPPKCYGPDVIDVPEHTVDVLVTPAIPEVPEVSHLVAGPWANWAPDETKGPQDYTPIYPDDDRGKWILHDKAETGPSQDEVGVFQQGGGNSPWFWRGEPVKVIDTPYQAGHDAVYRTDTIPATYKRGPEIPCTTDFPVPTTFNADPEPPTCEADGSFDFGVFDDEFENISVSLSSVTPGTTLVTITPDEGYVLTGLASPPWTIDENGVATRTIVVEPRDEDLCGEAPECVDGLRPVWHNWIGGPVGSEGPDADAEEGWHANGGSPQSDNHSVPPQEYGVPYNVSHGPNGKASWFLWTLEEDSTCVVEPATISPNAPVVKDLCGTEDDHYGLPTGPAGIAYTRGTGEGDRDIIATITAADTVWGLLGEGWVETSDTTAVFTFNSEQFTDVPCEEPPCEIGCFPTGIPFSATPQPATCAEPGSFDAESLGGTYNEESGRYEFENVNVEVLFDEETNEVTLNVFAHEGYFIDPALLEDDDWFVEEGGLRASITFELAAQLSADDPDCVTTTPPPPGVTPPTVITVTNPLAPAPVTYYAYSSDQLASTGSDGAWVLAGIAALLVFMGGSATIAVARRK